MNVVPSYLAAFLLLEASGTMACTHEPPVRSAPTVTLPVATSAAASAVAVAPAPIAAGSPAGPHSASGIEVFPLDGSPLKGPADALVTIVEFVDLECPPCAAAQGAVDRLLEAYPGQLRVVFKNYPLRSHPHAEAAARAAVAAGRQGKFWEMEHALLEGQQHLEPADIDGDARKLGLDLARFRADLAATDVADRVARDRQLGDSVKVRGTPTFYVDGRALGDGEMLDDRVREELGGRQ